MAEYTEIEDPKEIRRLNSTLSVRLESALPHAEDRTIGYPRGSFPAEVRFLSETGTDVFYWSPWVSDEKRAAGSFFGHGVPGSNASSISTCSSIFLWSTSREDPAGPSSEMTRRTRTSKRYLRRASRNRESQDSMSSKAASWCMTFRQKQRIPLLLRNNERHSLMVWMIS